MFGDFPRVRRGRASWIPRGFFGLTLFSLSFFSTARPYKPCRAPGDRKEGKRKTTRNSYVYIRARKWKDVGGGFLSPGGQRRPHNVCMDKDPRRAKGGAGELTPFFLSVSLPLSLSLFALFLFSFPLPPFSPVPLMHGGRMGQRVSRMEHFTVGSMLFFESSRWSG